MNEHKIEKISGRTCVTIADVKAHAEKYGWKFVKVGCSDRQDALAVMADRKWNEYEIDAMTGELRPVAVDRRPVS